ncbi:MAG: hypothetical protein IKN87_04755 [Bacilli bacterium]|nr:hypothetical protein [Bacilli bacterium]
MKKKLIILFIILIIIASIICAVCLLFPKNKETENYEDENTLYVIKFDDMVLRFERYDYSLGQNQLVGVEKTTDNGKTYKKLTTEPIIVSMEPQFVFLNKKLGFAISKPNLTKSNNYMGLHVTQDGGKTFTNSIINYDNPSIDILTIDDIPYKEDNILKLPCSIYQIKEDDSGYEDVKFIFTSLDNGLTWNLSDEFADVNIRVKNDTLTNVGATFILTNKSTTETYVYGNPYYLEIKENGNWHKLETINQLYFTLPAYNLTPGQSKEIDINWEYCYGKLKSGIYRLVKDVSRSGDEPIDESKIKYIYAEFEI